MRSETYTVKLNAETKENWQQLISEMMKNYGIETIGDVYPILIDIISSNSKNASNDLNEYIGNIRLNLDAVLKNVLAIDSLYQSGTANAEQRLTEAKAALVMQLEKEAAYNKRLMEELTKTKAELERANELVQSLKKENEELKTNKETQEEILNLLSELKKTKADNENA